MRIIEQTAGTLVLQEKPRLVSLVGGLFVVAGTGVALGSDERLFGAAFAAAGAAIILVFANTVTVTFNRTTGRFTRAVRGLVRNRETTLPLAAITGVDVEGSASADPSRAYRVTLRQSSGARVPLTDSYGSGREDKEQIASAIRQFLSLPDAAGAMPGFAEMAEMIFDPNAVERLAEILDAQPGQGRQHVAAARERAVRRGDSALVAQLDAMLNQVDGKSR
ncbi:MAG TPA: hypothetical protein VNJ03_06835 [Vicinamibacterales bacterium]|nr:hypothetical protein [Vicinamibacterales bacterium]